MEQREPVFGLWLELPGTLSPSELPLISCVLFSPHLSFSFSLYRSLFYLLPSSPRFFRRYISHSIFSHGSSSDPYTCLDIPLSCVLSSSTWFKWRLSALLEAAEEARSFRSVSSHTYSSLLSRLFPLYRSLSSSPVSSSIFSFSPEAGLTFSLEHSPL